MTERSSLVWLFARRSDATDMFSSRSRQHLPVWFATLVRALPLRQLHMELGKEPPKTHEDTIFGTSCFRKTRAVLIANVVSGKISRKEIPAKIVYEDDHVGFPGNRLSAIFNQYALVSGISRLAPSSPGSFFGNPEEADPTTFQVHGRGC